MRWSCEQCRLLKERAAFTLAEFLITFGIIGIVAAITLPSISANVQKSILRNQIKKVLTVYNQTLIQTIDYLGGDVNCYYSSTGVAFNDCPLFLREYTKKLKTVKTCYGNALANGCVPKYSSYGLESGCGGFSENYINNLDNVYILADGSIIISFMPAGGMYPLFAFDVNGKKGPNKPGYDLFGISINKNNGAFYFNNNLNSCIIPEEGGFTKISEIMSN